MIKVLIFLLILATALSQRQEFLKDNSVDYDLLSYQNMYPYPYQEDRERRIINLQREPNSNVNNEREVVVLPARLTQSREIEKFTSTSITSILWSVALKIFGKTKIVLKELLTNAPGLIFGGFIVVLFCKMTSVCTKLSSIQSLNEIQKELGTYITPERYDMAAEFIQEAIRRYRSIQNN